MQTPEHRHACMMQSLWNKIAFVGEPYYSSEIMPTFQPVGMFQHVDHRIPKQRCIETLVALTAEFGRRNAKFEKKKFRFELFTTPFGILLIVLQTT